MYTKHIDGTKSFKFKFVSKQLARCLNRNSNRFFRDQPYYISPSLSGFLLYMKVDVTEGVISPGIKSAGLWVVCGCGVPLLAFQFKPVILKTFLILLAPKISSKRCTTVSTNFIFYFDLIAGLYFQFSHPVGVHRRCGFGLRSPG